MDYPVFRVPVLLQNGVTKSPLHSNGIFAATEFGWNTEKLLTFPSTRQLCVFLFLFLFFGVIEISYHKNASWKCGMNVCCILKYCIVLFASTKNKNICQISHIQKTTRRYANDRAGCERWNLKSTVEMNNIMLLNIRPLKARSTSKLGFHFCFPYFHTNAATAACRTQHETSLILVWMMNE